MSHWISFLFPHPEYGSRFSLLMLLLRLLVGGLMLFHGIEKWQHFSELALTFPNPLGLGSRLSLILCLFAEVVCSIGVVLGLFFRPALLVLIFNMSVAAFVTHHGAPFAAKELALIYWILYILLFAFGAGTFAVDTGIGLAMSHSARG